LLCVPDSKRAVGPPKSAPPVPPVNASRRKHGRQARVAAQPPPQLGDLCCAHSCASCVTSRARTPPARTPPGPWGQRAPLSGARGRAPWRGGGQGRGGSPGGGGEHGGRNPPWGSSASRPGRAPASSARLRRDSGGKTMISPIPAGEAWLRRCAAAQRGLEPETSGSEGPGQQRISRARPNSRAASRPRTAGSWCRPGPWPGAGAGRGQAGLSRA
jgi:hypothetical protein